MSVQLPIPARERISSIDIVRGAVMILMALDHTRDYLSNARFSPLDLAHTTPALFFTRWVTHFCAPAFVLLAGTGAFLWMRGGGRAKPDLARFLLTRGAWLVILELTIVRLAWFLDLDFGLSLAQVIWAIGWSMIVLAGLIFLPNWLILSFASALIAGHNLLDRLPLGNGALWLILHRSGMTVELWPGHGLYILYPLIPWIGVMALGYALGPLFTLPAAQCCRRLLWIGSVMIVGFILLRLSNLYGDPHHWFPQRNTQFTLLSFINLEKYPPSLLFLLMTLGPVLIGLGFLEGVRGRAAGLLSIYGRVPLFYYVLHLFLIHLLAVGLAWARYGRADFLVGARWFFHEGYPAAYGYGLGGVYLAWLLVVAAVYPACRWFAELRRRRKDWWLSYL